MEIIYILTAGIISFILGIIYKSSLNGETIKELRSNLEIHRKLGEYHSGEFHPNIGSYIYYIENNYVEKAISYLTDKKTKEIEELYNQLI